MNPSTAQIEKVERAAPGERTRLLYEDVPGCRPPLFFDLAALSSLKSFEPLGIVLNRWSEGLLRATLRMSGAQTIRRDSLAIEHLLRSINLRNNYFAPVMSATAGIADHPSPIEPLQRAAALLMAAKAMHRDLLSGRFSPDRYRDGVLEMGQYPNLFATQVICDEGSFRLFKSTCTSQITVLAAGRFYSVELASWEDVWTASQLLNTLTVIEALSKKAAGGNASMAAISAAKPETQVKAWAQLRSEPRAVESLDRLRHSFVTVALDLDRFPSSTAEAAALAHSGNYANRWYNSALQIVVFGNSKACLIFNFNAYLDGNVQMRAASEIWNRATHVTFDAISDPNALASGPIQELFLPVSAKLLDQARNDSAAVSHDQQSTFDITGFGRSFFESRGLDPVATFVAALQLAVFRLTGRIPRIRQLLTMGRYRYMDLATALVTTPEMVAFLRSMQDEAADTPRRRELLQSAIDSQIRMCRTARRYFPAFRLEELLAESKGRIRRAYIRGVIKTAKLLLRLMRLSHFGHVDILISHPRVFDEVPVIGRPGICLPYLQCFGLHYQIREGDMRLTWMPGMKWNIPNADLTNNVIKSLHDIADIALR